jgi:predicted methyltransferase
MKAESFNTIIHDPPAQALCRTDLYGLEFYCDLRRILATNGQLFHYIGNPSSKESGRLYSGVIDRLLKAGFKTVQKVDSAFGVRAYN